MKQVGQHSQSGSALIYILVAIALLAVLTASLMDSSSQQTQSQNQTNLVSEISSQVSLISSSLQECVLTYPDQDSSLTSTQQKNAPYPIQPADTYFATSTPAADPNNGVQYIRCPGNPGGTGLTRKNHARIFGGSSGKFLPPPPNLFTAWEYYNGNDGIFFFTGTSKTDAFIASALTKLDAKYSKCEADVIDATGGAVTLTSDVMPSGGAVRTCPAGSRCFRYWIVQKATPSQQYGKDTGCPD